MIIKLLKIKYTFLIILSVLTISAINICGLYLVMTGNLESSTNVLIEQRLPLKNIADKLEQNDVIKHPKLFWFLAKLYSFKYPLKSGEYLFTAKISPLQVLNILATGKSVVHKLVIPEGSTVNEIINKINDQQLLLGEIKGTIPEGFLMPSTYFFSYGDQREQIIDQMRKNMSLALDEIMLKLPANSPLKTRLEVLTLASIIEKEAACDAERPIVAAVFLNRLKKNMKLQADPTTIYALTNGKFKLNRPLTKKDLALESPYNTYFAPALPPAPIACPGLKSLESVASPAKSNALYFVVNGQGGHHFSSSLSEHNNHVKAYRAQVKGHVD